MDYPLGWLLRTKQYSRRTSEMYDTFEQQFSHLRGAAMHFTAFGNFDRIEFVPVEQFGEYQDGITSDDCWYGKQRSILLYALEDCDQERLFFKQKFDGKDYLAERKGPNKFPWPLECRFFVHTMVYITGKARMSFLDYREFLRLIVRKVHEVVDCYRRTKSDQSECLKCEVFGTFHSAELSIIWAADQYVDVLYLMDQLRYLRFAVQGEDGIEEREICISTNTIICANKDVLDCNGNAKGTAMVQLECAAAYDKENPEKFGHTSTTCFIKSVFEGAKKRADEKLGKTGEPGDSVLLSCAGEYDYIVQTPFYVLPEIFWNRSTKNFSIHNKEFSQFIRQTTTRLGYKQSDIDEACLSIEWRGLLSIPVKQADVCSPCAVAQLDVMEQIAHEDIGQAKEGTTHILYRQIHDKMQQLVPHSGFHKLLELLYRDYEEIQCTAIDHLWAKDYHEQFVTVLNIISSYLVSLKEELERGFPSIKPEIYLNDLKELFGILQQQVNHISESSKLFFAAPNSKMGYTAQFDLIMHAYYGVVKGLIGQAYHAQKKSWQHILVPVINFANTNKVESAMLRTVDDDKMSSRLVSIQMPYAAWSNPLYYTPFLFHEIYHYVAPLNRAERNNSYLVIILHRLCMQRFFIFLKKTNSFEKSIGDLCKRLEQPLYSAIIKDRKVLYQLVSCPAADCTAYELRNALDARFGTYQEDNNFAKWIRAKLQEAIQGAMLTASDEPHFLELIQYLKTLDDNDSMTTITVDYSSDELNLVNSMLLELREIYPDMAMIHGSSMGLCEYLLQFAMLQNNLLNTPGSVYDPDMALRIGPIIEYLLGADKTLEDERDKFKQLFMAYLALSRNENSEIGTDEKDVVLAQHWFDYFARTYLLFCEEYGVYRSELQTQIKTLYTFSLADTSVQEIYHSYWNSLASFWSDQTVPQKIFSLTIRLIQHYQGQESLIELRQKWRSYASDSVPGEETCNYALGSISGTRNPYTTYCLYSSDQLFEQLRKMTAQLSAGHENLFHEPCGASSVWYRGVSNSSYHILPSMFVRFSLDEKWDGNRIRKTPASLLEHRFQQFKLRSDGALEISNQYRYQSSDYLALMQHYQTPTNMLDWSEDVFGSLYFALEDYIKNDRNKPSRDTVDAAIYLFDPAAYNLAREQMIKACLPDNNMKKCEKCLCNKQGDYDCQQSQCIRRREGYVRDTVFHARDRVPNVSVELNRDIYEPLFCGQKREYTDGVDHYTVAGMKGCSAISCAPLCFDLPIAVYTSRLNPRIRAQWGQFVVFDPYTPPVVPDIPKGASADLRGCYDYIALDRIQNDWLNADSTRMPFLLKLIIKSDVKQDLAEQLKLLGIHTIKYYPELTNARFSFE